MTSSSVRTLVRVGAMVWLLCTALRAAGQGANYSAEEVKAAFLYHFATYVEWPNPPADDGITIAVLGADGVAAQLQQFLPGRRIQGRPVTVQRVERIEQARGAEVLFIGSELNDRLDDLIPAVDMQPTLIVTDAEDGLARGAMVNFQLVDERVRFEISLRKAQDAELTLSSRLLSAAIRVETSSCAIGCRDWSWPPAVEFVKMRRGLGLPAAAGLAG